MGFQENIPGVGTSDTPAWTVHDGNSVWIVWKGSGTDTTIWLSSAPSLQPNSSGVYGFSPQNQVKTASGGTFGTSTGPAVASLNGTLYIFYKDASDNYIHWATSSDGVTWTDKQKLTLGNSVLPQNNNQNPQTSAAPAVAAANNCLYLFWRGASDNTIYWTATSDQTNPGLWAFQQKVTTPTGTPATGDSPAITLASQTIHLIWKGSSDDTIYWSTYSTPVSPDGNNLNIETGGPWSNQQQILSGPAHSPAIVCDGNGVVWLAYTGADGGVSFAGLVNGQWNPVYNRLGIGSSKGPALISTGDSNASIMMAWKGAGSDTGIYYGSMIGPQVGVPTGPVSGTALGSNLNYLMANLSGNNGNPLTGVRVTILVTEDIKSDIGIGFQLNAYSNSGALSAWQQYFIWQNVVSNTEVQIRGEIEPWPQSTAGTGNQTTTYDLLDHWYVLTTLSNTTIPKGYQFTIALGTSGNQVSSAQFRVVDTSSGNVLYDQPAIPLVGLSLDDGTTTTVGATAADLAAIVAFQLNVVGPISSEQSYMLSGAGIITYEVSGAMSANKSLPANADSNWFTLEQTNSVYSTLPQGTSSSFVQTFRHGDIFGSSGYALQMLVVTGDGRIMAGASDDGLNWWHGHQKTPGFVDTGHTTRAAPSLVAVTSSRIFLMAMLAQGSNDLLWRSSAGGVNWAGGSVGSQQSESAPCLMMYDNANNPGVGPWIAYVANTSNEVLVTSAVSWESPWSGPTPINQTSKAAPAFRGFIDYYVMVFLAEDSSNRLLACRTQPNAQGENVWLGANDTGQQSQAAPSIAALNNNLWMAFLSNDASREILVCSSSDGISWSGATKTGHQTAISPCMTNCGGVLFIAYVGVDDGIVRICLSQDGIHWSESNPIAGLTTGVAPAIAGYNFPLAFPLG